MRRLWAWMIEPVPTARAWFYIAWILLILAAIRATPWWVEVLS